VRLWLLEVMIVLLAVPPNMTGQQAAPSPQTQPMAPLPTVRSLTVVPLAGNGEMNDLEGRVMAPLVVQVLDQNDRPIEGADVVFRFPMRGPGGSFAGQKNKTERTNGQGQAAATGWTANDQVGTFQVHVTAAYGNQVGEATISMTNVTRIVEGKMKQKHPHWYSSKWAKIGVIAGAAGVAATIVLATRGGKSSLPSITISPGAPTVGSPH
jgi:hypothetical protein